MAEGVQSTAPRDWPEVSGRDRQPRGGGGGGIPGPLRPPAAGSRRDVQCWQVQSNCVWLDKCEMGTVRTCDRGPCLCSEHRAAGRDHLPRVWDLSASRRRVSARGDLKAYPVLTQSLERNPPAPARRASKAETLNLTPPPGCDGKIQVRLLSAAAA